MVTKYEQYYGENHQSHINALINLASVMKDLGENEDAIPIYERAIKARIATEGPDSVNVAMAKAMVAGAYRDTGDYV